MTTTTYKPEPGDLVRVVLSEWFGMERGETAQIGEQDLCVDDAKVPLVPLKGLYGGRAFYGRSTAYAPESEPEVCSTSGGPWESVPVAYLQFVERIVSYRFWRWADRPRADGGEHYARTVSVWELPLLVDEFARKQTKGGAV